MSTILKRDPPFFEVTVDYERQSPWVRPNRPWEKIYAMANYEGEPIKLPKTINYPLIPLHYLLRDSAQGYPNNVAVYYTPKEIKYTYREIEYYSDKLAAALYDLGTKKGSAVGLYMANCPEYFISLYAISQTGAAITPINPLLKTKDVTYILRDAAIVDTVICSAGLYPVIRAITKEISLRHIIVVGEPIAETMDFWELLNKYPPTPPQVTIDPKEDLCALLYSGGTTGLPKGVMLTHFNIVADVLTSSLTNIGEDNPYRGIATSLGILPLCHSFGFTMAQTAVYAKAMLVLYDGFDPGVILRDIEKFRPISFVGIPLIYVALVNHPDFEKSDLSSILLSVSGADVLPLNINDKWKKVAGTDVAQGYGLSETSPSTHIQPRWLPVHKYRSVGIPLLDTDVKVVDIETHTRELPPGQVGELMIKGPQVMKGYWQIPDKTREVLTADGWLMTGDLARMDEDGYFYIEGRAKEMIKYKGYKVMPEEVEKALYDHEAISQVAAVGVPDERVGETIKAFVVLHAQYAGKISEEDILRWAEENMTDYKRPRELEFVEALATTAVGKIYRHALREAEIQKRKSRE